LAVTPVQADLSFQTPINYALGASPFSVTTGDFNGDGKTDILWRHKTNGQSSVWLRDGTTWSSSVSLPAVSDTSWEIV